MPRHLITYFLPPDQKETLLALAKFHVDDKSTYDDFIIGKGRGMIGLLHGEPGLGKTLTAGWQGS